jgi:hypothetical protein
MTQRCHVLVLPFVSFVSFVVILWRCRARDAAIDIEP